MKIIITSYPQKPKDIKKFCSELVWSKLIACVSRINYVKSFFIWEGKLKNENEAILVLKVKDGNVEKVISFIEKKHPYSVPEIIVLSPEKVSEKYLEWIQK